jgi:DnaJ like chaperone protein
VETRQAIFFASTFAMLGKMAKADGRVSDAEIQVVNQFIRTRLGVDERARQFAINIFNEAKSNNTPFSAYARQFGEQFIQEREMRVMLFELLFELAMADGTLHPAEEALLEEALGPLGLSRDLYEELRGKKPGVGHLYTLLGVTSDASDAELKQAWRNAVRDFHPDRIVSKGLPDEFTKFAEEKFQEVNDAYETIMEHRGRSNQ